ncbi:MAG: hypothetical protein JJU20_01885 [Opitutales bacterium]|nr:hypothetical protein [Opitutales bacterium]
MAIQVMDFSAEEYADLARKLESWYWQFGLHREEPYALPPGKWLTDISRSARTLERGHSALRNSRPAMAIWGPSQTGKSTVISSYIDAGINMADGSAQQEGEGLGLHWPGGLPFFFMAPRVADPESLPSHLTRMVLNPFNKGMDGSACLTRFVPGSTEAREDHHQVTDPKYPVELHLVQLDDLWHALARGYSTECLGRNDRQPKAWDLERLQRATRDVLAESKGKPGPANAGAFNELMRLREVLNDLAASDDPVFSELSTDRDTWHSYLRGLFQEPALLASRDMVRRLAERILWDDAPTLSRWFRLLAQRYDAWLGPDGSWANRRLLCSLEAAALFLNMGASAIAYAPRQNNPDAPYAIIQDLVSRLACEVDDETVRIGCESGLSQPLGQSAEEFSILQGLVWELVVPINMDHLPEHPFADDPEIDPEASKRPNALKNFLEVADILDFPGVGNETKSLENRIIIDEKQIAEIQQRAKAPDATPQDQSRAEKCFTPVLFFREILKRGKTASIVATYGKRLNIDAFAIFQGARGYACPNADQIINGVKTWWRHLAPDYLKNPQGESPFPLNLVITWWAKQLNLAQNPDDTNIYGVIEGIVSNLGIIRDAKVSTTFAIHDHQSPDRDQAELKVDVAPGSTRYKNLTNETAFKHQFAREISRQSFDAMVSDKLTGGAEFFFLQAREQMLALRERSDGRTQRIQTQMVRAAENLLEALNWPDLVPQPKVQDKRREHLEAFLEKVRTAIEQTDVEALRGLNRFLRELVNIHASNLPGVPERNQVSTAAIENAFDSWVAEHSQSLSGDARFQTEARLLGLNESAEIRTLLRSLVESIRPDLPAISEWLKKSLAVGSVASSAQYQRLLALRMGNALVYGEDGPRTSNQAAYSQGTSDLTIADTRDAATRFFIAPLIGDGGRIQSLAEREVTPRKRPDLAGDDAIRSLFEAARELNLPETAQS